MNLDIATKDDLRELKEEILEGLKQIKEAGVNRSKKYLRSSEMREMFNISAGTLQNMRINGTLPYSKVGTTILYDLDEVVGVFNENKVN
ncbi:helix-turn-helix domain-containing protein [Polaribacter undariae]|uniref:Helix-turn-helix domain-containing protein n=1 Tax=Polaribacter sejongensis TaxID=985043 RepID=A0AAJ1QYN1_9FLAO|nr:helix-turn-helix domain-containing protein [Polaribacter undariae]MDN3620764.1 helix-turn-helix domain-containing protein [Polaribacter undariae]UWD31364.1 helix-turn-helix domain-containing protein [Polaribacter undariae]